MTGQPGIYVFAAIDDSLEQDISRPVLDPVVHAETLRAFSARLPRVAHQRVTRYKRQGRA